MSTPPGGTATQYALFAACAPGLEALLQEEVAELGLVPLVPGEDGADEVELFIHERSVDFPRDERERIRGFIHQDLQDRDYLPLEPGAPLFETLDGETLRYDGPPGLCPVFINEAAYYEKKIAFSLTRREVRRI